MSTRSKHKDLMILAGHTYKNEKFILPANWQELTSFTAGNGFQATVYKNGNEIMAQLQSIGIPTKCDLPKSYIGTAGQRKWVTINGNHVLINK